ncbi:hypothetical protein EV702DRAFT_1203275 [Suillus placidus]|uniref:Uncharacterized protein n=1 Tax=Suillus placidus TaxID=48579 RepID=A0A9P6ZL38_9AGAM|nr:hypothetical protein EV702DRAFT_1203275 [Suillus placidus]
MSLCLNAASTEQADRHSGHTNAGMGGRNAQLEKIGILLEAPSQNHLMVVPPPYSSLATMNPNTSHIDVSTMEPLQPLNPSFHQTGGIFGFTMHVPNAPPDPDINNPYAAVGRKVAVRQAHKTITGPSAANPVAPLTGFLDQNINPALWDVDMV